MPVGYHPRTDAERCQIHARLHRGWSKREMARDLGPGSRDDLARDLGPRWPARRPAPTGRPPGRGPAPGRVGGAPAEDPGALGGGRGPAAGRLEPGADRGPGSVAGGRDGGDRVDRSAGAGRSAGRRDPVSAPAPSGPEAERARRPPCGSGSPSRSGRPGGTSGRGRGEEPDGRRGARPDHRCPAPGGAGVGRRSGLEVSVPGVDRRQDGLRRDRSHYPAHEAGSGSGPPQHRRPRPGVRETSRRSALRALPSLPRTLPGNGASTSIPTAGCTNPSRRGPTAAR